MLTKMLTNIKYYAIGAQTGAQKRFISRATRDSKVSNERTRQIITLLYTHSSMVTSEGVRKHQKEALDEVIKRMYRNIGYYEGNDVILTNFEFFKNVVDIFYS